MCSLLLKDAIISFSSLGSLWPPFLSLAFSLGYFKQHVLCFPLHHFNTCKMTNVQIMHVKHDSKVNKWHITHSLDGFGWRLCIRRLYGTGHLSRSFREEYRQTCIFLFVCGHELIASVDKFIIRYYGLLNSHFCCMSLPQDFNWALFNASAKMMLSIIFA